MAEQDPAQGSTTPEQGPPSDRQRLEEVYRYAKGQAPNTPEKETPVQGFWNRVVHGVEGKSRLKEMARSIPRGLANVGNNVVRTAAEAGAGVADALGIGGTEEQQDARREKAKKVQVVSEEELDITYGARSDDPIAALTESLTQGAASMLLLRTAGLGNITAGAATDAIAFNPYEQGLSEILAQHGDKVPGAGKLLQALGNAGSVDADDSFLESRLKRVVEGGIAGAIFGGAVEAVKWTRKLARARASGDVTAIAEAEAKVAAIEDGTHTPEGARVVARPDEDGTWSVEEVELESPFKAEGKLALEVDGVRLLPPDEARPRSLVFETPDGTQISIHGAVEDGDFKVSMMGANLDEEEALGLTLTSDQLKQIDEEMSGKLGARTMLAVGQLLRQQTGAKSVSGFRIGGARPQRQATRGLPLPKKVHQVGVESPRVSGSGVEPRFTRTEAEVQAATMNYALKMQEFSPPPVQPGMVRMYHGGNDYQGGPRWLTVNRDYAEGYAKKSTGGKLHYVDVPEDHPMLTKAFDDTGTDVKAPFNDFNAPEDIARGLRPMNSRFSSADLDAHFETAERIKNAESVDDAIQIVGGEDHFNLGAIASGEDFNAQMRGLIARYQEAFNTAKKRPSVPQDETIKAAASFARTLGIEDWAQRIAGSKDKMALSVETVLKVSAVRQVGDRLAEISKLRSARPHDPALLTEAKRLLDVWHGISLEAFEHRSELGRSMNILGALKDQPNAVRFGGKKVTNGNTAGVVANVNTPAPKGLAANMTPEEIDLTLRLFERSGGEPRNLHAVAKAMDVQMRQAEAIKAGRTTPAKVADWVTTVYINALISGAKTAQSIFQSGMAMNALEATSRMLAGTVTGNKALAQEGAAYWYAMFRYSKENMKSAAAAFSEGTSVLEGSSNMYVKSGVTGTLVTVPGRVAGSIDEFTRATAYRAEEFAKALRSAQESGLSFADAVKRAEEDVKFSVDSRSGIAMNPVALERAGVPTLSNPLGNDTFMGKIANAIADSPYGKLIIPFMRPSVNTFRYVWQNTPGLNLLNKQSREIILAGGEEAAVLHTRSVIAGSMMVYAYSKFSQGEMTGNGPSDPALRKAWLQNHQPYSLRVGDDWVSYRRMEPFASWLGMVADASEATHEIDSDGDRQSVMGAVFTALMKNSYNKSWTQGLAQFLDAWDVKDKNAIQRWGKGLASGFVPYAVSQFNTDPYIREARSVVDGVRAKIPGLSNDLPAKYNLVGEPVMRQGSMWNRNFSTTPIKSAKASLLEDTLLENNIGLNPYPSKIAKGQIDLLDQRWEKNGKLPYIRFMEILKENDLRGELEAEIRSDSFQRASGGTPEFPGGQREARLKAIKDVAEQKALSQVLREFDSTGLTTAYKGAQYVLPVQARYKGPDAEAAAREKYGIPAVR